ncbi:MAG: hypothetical protein ACRDD7_15225 [Peptostreptococcaceae bacterium]
MSQYIYICSDEILKEIDKTNPQTITVKQAIERGIKAHDFMPWSEFNENDEIVMYEDEDSFANLLIFKQKDELECARYYTKMKYIYDVVCGTDMKRANQLFDYILENIKNDIELRSIWLDEKVNIKEYEIKISDLRIEDILNVFNNFNYCIRIRM